MSLMWNIIQILLTVLEIRVCVLIMEKYASPRFRGSMQKVAVWIVSLAGGGLYALNRWSTYYYSWLMILIILGILALGTLWIFSEYRGVAIFVASNYLFLGGLLDFVLMSSAEIVTGRPDVFAHLDDITDEYRILLMLLSKACLFLISWAIVHKIDGKIVRHLKGKNYALIGVLFCMAEQISEWFLIRIINTDTTITQQLLMKLVLYLMVVLFLLIIGGIYLLYREGKRDLYYQNLFLENLNRNYQYMVKVQRERDIMYHDLKNHLLVLDHLAREGQYEQYQAYMDKIKEPFQQRLLERKTGNDIMDLVLGSKIGEATEKGILVEQELQGYLDYELKLSDGEVCALFGNLWDNAIEACLRLKPEERRIWFSLQFQQKLMIMTISNPCYGISQNVEGNLLSTKEDNHMHGIGMNQVKRIIEKHRGHLVYGMDDTCHTFRVEVMFYHE